MLVAAYRSTVALRHGAVQANGPVDTGVSAASTAGADGGGAPAAIGPGEIPF
jgi:hypothetical protein